MITILYGFVVVLVAHGHLFCNPMDCSLPSSSVDRIFQARILEWLSFGSTRVARILVLQYFLAIPATISFSRDLPDPGVNPRFPYWQADPLPLSHQGGPYHMVMKVIY